tara:strand:- start:696 stop:2297 length:1602 start_codon:yes stop_codon:yes gene_type:complete
MKTLKTYLFKSILLFTLLPVIFNCSKNEDVEKKQETQKEEEVTETFNYTSTSKYSLNVIYFIPKDMSIRTDSHRRLSEILLQGQEFYKQNMISYGFGEKTFGLFEDKEKDRVKITYIEGKHNASNYPSSGGGTAMRGEIQAYFDKNPTEKASEHFLVTFPVDDPKTADVSYYGQGKWSFASDFNDMDIKHLGNGGTLGTNATTYIGGMLHELGHGLNLPHNKEKVSDASSTSKGTSLMGNGNYTYGYTSTFLSEASCAILNNNQVFNNTDNQFYAGATASVTDLNVTYSNGNIDISGRIDSDVPVNSINIYHDPADDNTDYDAVSWSTKVESDNTFTIATPIDELHKKGNIPYVLRLGLNHTSGDMTYISYAYKFVNDIPIIDIGEKDYTSRINWSINDFSSEQTGGLENTGLASAILDNNPDTYWHSCYSGSCSSGAAYPHSITVDTGALITVDGFAFTQRQNLSRSIKDLEILISDDNATWTSTGDYTLLKSNNVQNIRLKNQAAFRYFKIVAKSAHDENRFAALAEVFCF